MLNHITVMGRLTRDPEMRRTGSGISVANFTLAVDRDFADKQSGQKETDFVDCVAWRQTADFVGKYFRKGNMMAVSGRLQSRKWTDKDGNKRTSWEVQADNVYFAESKNSAQSQSGGAGYASEPYGETAAYVGQMLEQQKGFDYPYPGSNQASDFVMLDDVDGQLPF